MVFIDVALNVREGFQLKCQKTKKYNALLFAFQLTAILNI